MFVPGFKVANAVIHFDEASPHMHVVGVPVYDGYKKGLSKRVSKRNVFTKEVMSLILQGKLRDEAEMNFKLNIKESFAEKKVGRNHDLSVAEYKVAKESEKLEALSDKIEKQQHNLGELNGEIYASKTILRIADEEYEEKKKEIAGLTKVIEQTRQYVSAFKLFAPTIEEYAVSVEQKGRIEAGNSFRGILNELGRLLEHFKELIKEGLCWFPRLMKWNTSVGEVAPVFTDKNDGYDYVVCGYVNLETKVQYSREELHAEIKAECRVGTVEQLDANLIALEKDIAEVLRLSGEQKRL